MTLRLDKSLLRPVDAMDGGKAGPIRARWMALSFGNGGLSTTSDAAGGSIGPSTQVEIGGFTTSVGRGERDCGSETAAIKADDAVPLNSTTKSFENTGTAPLELMSVGVVKDLSRKMEIVGAYSFGGRGRGAAPGRGNAAPARGAQ